MQIIPNTLLRFAAVASLTLGLTLAPVLPDIAMAAEGVGAAGAGTYEQSTEKTGGTAAGVGVSGSSGKPGPAGKGALAPPPGTAPAAPKSPAKSAKKKPAENQTVPNGIAASAGAVGKAAASAGGGISMGWKIAGGVLGVGLLVGLAGGGGSSGGGASTSNHP
jgi:hypothetical protein